MKLVKRADEPETIRQPFPLLLDESHPAPLMVMIRRVR